MENKKKVAVITGASSGIGLAAAKALLARGYTVYNLSRSRCPENGVVSLRCDVCSEADIAGAFAKVAEKSGGIDRSSAMPDMAYRARWNLPIMQTQSDFLR